MKSSPSYDKDVRERLEALKATPPRRPEAADKGRAAYLQSMHTLRQEYLARASGGHKLVSPQAVSVPVFERLKGWIDELRSSPMRKENYRMAGTLIAIIVTVSLMFGSAGAVYAAQNSLPDDALYPVKILSEDTRLGLTTNPLREMELALDFADRRVGEMAALAQAGDPIPEEVGYRLQTHLNLALQAAAGLEDTEIGSALEQARSRIEQQLHVLNMTQANGPLGNDPVLVRVQAHLRLQIGLADLGLEDPMAFRLRLRQNALATEHPSVTPEPGSGYGPGPGPLETPGCPDCTPEGDANSYGPGPSNQGATTQPDEGYGPGPGTGPGPVATQTVDPSYDGNGNPSNSNQGDDSNQGGNNGDNGEGNSADNSGGDGGGDGGDNGGGNGGGGR